jgi:hypothetical protein
LPEQFGAQHVPAAVHLWPALHVQSCWQLLQFSPAPGSHIMSPQMAWR